MAIPLKNLSYRAGMPGMVASMTAKHTRQMTSDPLFVKMDAPTSHFGTAALLNRPNGTITTAATAGAVFFGVFLDNSMHTAGTNGYAQKELLNLLTMGDIWVRTTLGVTIKPGGRCRLCCGGGHRWHCRKVH
ncbi:hypothetical protein HC928_04550 [bacterium]|nr:hypothetical protein [bacterium]